LELETSDQECPLVAWRGQTLSKISAQRKAGPEKRETRKQITALLVKCFHWLINLKSRLRSSSKSIEIVLHLPYCTDGYNKHGWLKVQSLHIFIYLVN
jgi:hypothetical protein